MLCKYASFLYIPKYVIENHRGDDGKDGNPFEGSGYMEKWTMVGRAKNIAVPTLVINGIDEYASGDAVKPFLDEIPDVRLVTIEGTTHSPFFERKEEYMKVVGDFLTSP
jgi:pimeloyl-ACP methyl ester carboxylesterase